MTETITNSFNRAISDLQAFGRQWAVAALTGSAASLKTAADYLDGLSAKLTVEAAAAEQGETAQATEAEAADEAAPASAQN